MANSPTSIWPHGTVGKICICDICLNANNAAVLAKRTCVDYTARKDAKYVHTPYRETVYKISEALNEAGIAHEIHVRPGYTTIWAHPDLHEQVSEIARRIDQEWIDAI